ncbi:MAG: winged helix-turn-helix domain-containing protein [Candidatus Acidiferrales bacterium]
MAETPSQNSIFRFGLYELEGDTGELRKEGKARPRLQRQPLEVLLVLLGRPGQVVTREELRQRLWPADTFVDYEHSLNAAVNKLREALNDTAENPRFIQTIPRRGYRFIASVEVLNGAQSIAPAEQMTIPAATQGDVSEPRNLVLSDARDLPAASHGVVRLLFSMIQLMYLSFYVAALVDVHQVNLILAELTPHPKWIFVLLLVAALCGIPIRLYLLAAIAFRYRGLGEKFRRLFPLLLLLDEFWALAPLLLVDAIGIGLALAATAALLYVPFAQRSLLLMRREKA